MFEISKEIDKLTPFLLNGDKFTDSKNEKIINEHLNNLVNLFKTIQKHPKISTTGFSISRDQIETQLKETLDAFNSKHQSFARHKLNSTLGLCISCHTQLPTGEKLKIFGGIDIEKNIQHVFEKAEFYFITRDFPKAIQNYDLFISQYKKNDDRLLLESALNHKLTYFTRIMRTKTEEAIASFNENLKNKEIPETTRLQITNWIKELKATTALDNTGKPITEKQMKQFLKKVTRNNEEGPRVSMFANHEAQDLKISGILYEYLNSNPESSLVPEILYNLATIDKRLNFNIFYSLGDLYLKECIEKYPTSRFAKLCYQEYEEEKILSYTGSAGTFLPEDVKKELDELKNKLKIKK
jgi:tetratricopeptide (TPR) repeat protein